MDSALAKADADIARANAAVAFDDPEKIDDEDGEEEPDEDTIP